MTYLIYSLRLLFPPPPFYFFSRPIPGNLEYLFPSRSSVAILCCPPFLPISSVLVTPSIAFYYSDPEAPAPNLDASVSSRLPHSSRHSRTFCLVSSLACCTLFPLDAICRAPPSSTPHSLSDLFVYLLGSPSGLCSRQRILGFFGLSRGRRALSCVTMTGTITHYPINSHTSNYNELKRHPYSNPF
jgi:hypothetical protein